MRLLLDSHVLLAIVRDSVPDLGPDIAAMVTAQENELFASAASFWEIAIKTRLGKLDPGTDLEDLPAYFVEIGVNLLVLDHRHAVGALPAEPATCDSFDRMLLVQCSLESLRLITIDRALAPHPLVWRP